MKKKIINDVDTDLKSIRRNIIKKANKLKKTAGNIDRKQLLRKAAPYIIFAYIGNKYCYGYRVTDAPDGECQVNCVSPLIPIHFLV